MFKLFGGRERKGQAVFFALVLFAAAARGLQNRNGKTSHADRRSVSVWGGLLGKGVADFRQGALEY